MKVAIGIDGSELANQAVRYMGRLLSPKVDDLLLYYSPPAFHLSSKTEVPETVLKKAAEALSDGVFKEASHFLSPEMRMVTSTLRSERLPADGLVELAEENDVDLVVVGSKSAKRKFPFVLGSTARNVIHHTGKPVMVVRGEFKPNDEPLKVVVACDEERWCDATGVLRDFSWPENTETTLFHVTEAFGDEFVESLMMRGRSHVPNSTGLVRGYQAAIEKRKERSATRLAQLKKSGPSIIQNANIEVEQGDIVDELVEKIERDNVDLLVLSSRRLGMIGRMLGSVTESLLSRCPCSLLIVHAVEPSERATEEYSDEELARMFEISTVFSTVTRRCSQTVEQLSQLLMNTWDMCST